LIFSTPINEWFLSNNFYFPRVFTDSTFVQGFADITLTLLLSRVLLAVFTIVSGLLSGREPAGFFLSFIYILALDFLLSRGEGSDPINRLNPATCLCLSQDRTWISDVICRGPPFCVQ